MSGTYDGKRAKGSLPGIEENLVIASEGVCREDVTYPPGALVGSYWVEDVIGAGGTACVYKARHTKLNRMVALKALQTKHADKDEVVERFFAEARAANKVAHENIVQVTDLVEDTASGTHYFVMELLEGFDLRELIDLEGALPPERCVLIALQVADAIEAAHQAGVIHRDLKPANIYLVESEKWDDFVKILDFGVAKVEQEVERWREILAQSTVQTSPGAIIGTPGYMSPEQLSGSEVGPWSDIYAFGLVLYEMVTGGPPFFEDNLADVVVAHKTVIPDAPRDRVQDPSLVPDELEELILQCLEKNPDDRPQSMKEIRDRLAALAQKEGWRQIPLSSLAGTGTEESRPADPRTSTNTLRMERPDLVEATRGTVGEPTLPGVRPDLVAETSRRSEPPAPPPASPDAERTATAAAQRERVEAGPPARARRGLVIGVAVAAVIAVAGLAALVLGRDGGGGQAEGPAPAGGDRVVLSFTTAPAGAKVFYGDDVEPLGATPFEASFPRSEKRASFEIQLEGYREERRTVELDADRTVSATLVRLATEGDAGISADAGPAPSEGSAEASPEEARPRGTKARRGPRPRPRKAGARPREAQKRTTEGRPGRPARPQHMDAVIDPYAD